jgi:DNA topoisomerase-3
LTTVELQKSGSRLLKLAPKKILDVRLCVVGNEMSSKAFHTQIAEKLYQQGFLSYPRTETDRFDPQFNFMSLIEKQVADPAWGGFARE